MPLTYDDREDLYLEIERLRKLCQRLEKENDFLRERNKSLCDDVEQWRQQLHNTIMTCGVFHG